MKINQRRLFAVSLASLFFAAACGASDSDIANATPTTLAADASAETASDDTAMGDTAMDAMDDMEMEDMGDGHHDHGDGVEVPADMAVPAVSIEVVADPMGGQTLLVDLENFRIAPENASTEPVNGEGHLHLYVDGERTIRFYNQALHLKLPAGDHDVMVEVSANNHSAYTVDGEAIRAMQTVTAPEAGHSHGEPAAVEFEGNDAPSVSLDVVEDPKSGWNVSLVTQNFVFSPEDVSTAAVPGEGHAHLYVDGNKVARLYGPNWHLPELSAGTHEISVGLNHNDHAAYADDGKPIEASVTVEVASAETDAHDAGDDHRSSDADVVINASFAAGEVTVDTDRIDVPLGSTVALTVSSDIADELHVHGYNEFADVGPDANGTVSFVADAPGLFEVELERNGTFLFEIEVS